MGGLFIASVLLALVPAIGQSSYVGKTWLTWPQDEREEFVNGYIAYPPVAPRVPASDGRLVWYEREIVAHLEKTPRDGSMEMADLIRLVNPRVQRANPLRPPKCASVLGEVRDL